MFDLSVKLTNQQNTYRIQTPYQKQFNIGKAVNSGFKIIYFIGLF